jgi:hypothetical protein
MGPAVTTSYGGTRESNHTPRPTLPRLLLAAILLTTPMIAALTEPLNHWMTPRYPDLVTAAGRDARAVRGLGV